ncbi:MAG: PTS ascorbate transporter subunit IIC [Saprospiraceae bacterium]|nr:PTS ascorbate transporter subunit IIC [Saprospiraceae bacterium]
MEKKKFVLRIDASTMAAVEKWAADEFRSVNGQLEWLITKYLRERGRMAPEQSESIPEDQKKEGPADAGPSNA